MAVRTGVNVRVASGRAIYGYPPGNSRRGHTNPLRLLASHQDRDRMEEPRLRDELARQLDGITEGHVTSGRVNLGFADVVTKQRAFEVEPHYSWRHGARQVIQYAAQCDLKPALAVFGYIHQRVLHDIHNCLQSIELPGLRPRGSIELWCWTGPAWVHVTQARQVTDMPYGISFEPCGPAADRCSGSMTRASVMTRRTGTATSTSIAACRYARGNMKMSMGVSTGWANARSLQGPAALHVDPTSHSGAGACPETAA